MYRIRLDDRCRDGEALMQGDPNKCPKACQRCKTRTPYLYLGFYPRWLCGACFTLIHYGQR